MELLTGLASLTIALWIVALCKMPFPANIAAAAFASLVIYILMYSLAAYTVRLLSAITGAVTSIPAFIPLFIIIGVVIGYLLAKRGGFGGGGPFGRL